MNLAFKHFTPRRPLDERDGVTDQVPFVLESSRCYNMFGGGASKSDQNSTNQQVAASEGSLAVGAGGKFQEAGSVDLSHSTAAQIGNTALDAGGDVIITSSDAGVLTNALDKLTELSAGYGSSLNQFISQATADQDKKVATLLGAMESAKQKEGSAFNVQGLVYSIIAALLIGFVASMFSKKKGS